MSEKPPIDSLPFDVTGVDENGDTLELTYRNELGNSVTRRTYRRAGTSIHERDSEWMYNYQREQWEQTHEFTREYDLAEDEATLVGDGSGWDGAGRQWKEWFTERHFERLTIRYQDSVLESSDSAPQQPAGVRSGIAQRRGRDGVVGIFNSREG